MKQKLLLAALAGGFAAASANAATIFEDNFDGYGVSNPADFGVDETWSHNGVDGGQGTNANRIFHTGNFGGTDLWIAHPSAFGSGINSRGIDAEANTDYYLSAALVVETWTAEKQKEFSIDVLAGQDLLTATSLIGGPQSHIARGDAAESVPGSVDDTYDDQMLNIPFNSGALGAGDQLFIQIVLVGDVEGVASGWAGVDNVSIGDSPVPEPGSLALLGLGGLAIARRRRK